MEKNKKLSFQEEMEREAKKIEEELKEYPELDSLTVSDELDAKLLEQIRAYEKEGKKDNTETEKKIVKFPHKKKFIFVLVAAMLLVLGTGVTSIGSKSYLKKTEDGVYGAQKVQKMNVDDMEKQESVGEEEVFAFQEVEEKIGIVPVKLKYKPNSMEFLNSKIDEEEQRAKIFYTYKNNMIRYDIYKNESDSSLGQNQEDEVLKEFEMVIDGHRVTIKRVLVSETQEERSVLSFQYKEINYQLYGVINVKEMKKIAENLKFL